MSFSGYTNAGAQLGLQTLIIKPAKRGFANLKLSNGSDFPDGGGVVNGLLKADATIEELHSDEMEITDHPIEQGANIADHAFKHAAELILKLAWSNSPVKSASLVNAALGAAANASPVGNTLAKVVGGAQAVVGFYNQYQQNSGQILTPSNQAYDTLLQMQAERVLFDIYTGRRKYSNMVVKSLAVHNDWKTENALFITVGCKQIILVNSHTVTFEKNKQLDASATTSTKSLGSVSAAKKS
jgi:hypothetical protein